VVLTGTLLSRMRQFVRRRPAGIGAGPGSWLPIRWATAWEVIELMTVWLDADGPLEAVGKTIAEFRRVDSQELAQRAIATVIRVFDDNLRWSRRMVLAWRSVNKAGDRREAARGEARTRGAACSPDLP
jgi:hypothetical protein